MSKYKKKTANKRVLKRKTRPVAKREVNIKNDNVPMRPVSQKHAKVQKRHEVKPTEQKAIRVINGTKLIKQKKRIIVFLIVFVLLLAVVLFSALTPTGPFEYFHNKILSIGNGSFPASLSGGELLNAFSADKLTYTITDSHAEIFNNSGKLLFSRQHEFNSPSISVASQRALIYDRGGKKLYIYNNNDVIHDITLQNDIYCASIGRNGNFAVASESVGYTSQVEVFNKNVNTKYVWYSSDELVNSVALSNNGNRVAVATVDVSGGQYKSKVYVFKYSSADPLFVLEYDGIIYSIETISNSRFIVVTDDSVDFVKWNKGERLKVENKYSLNVFRRNDRNISAVVTGNNSSNNITLLNRRGKELASFDFNGSVTDVSVIEKNVFVLSDSYLYILDYEGKVLSPTINLSSYNRIFAIDKSSVIAAGNFGLNKVRAE